MEQRRQSFFSADDANYLARAEAADRANEYLYRVLDIGQYMLQSGAEISRVEDSIRRLCASFGAERIDVLSITSSIVVTIYAPQFGAVTQTRRVAGQQYDLHRLEQLNQLSRRICTQYLSLEETEAALEEIRKTPQYPFGVQLFTYALISASFSLFFGGSVLDAVKALPENYRNAIYLHYYEGYTTAEIGRMLKVPTNTVLSWLRRARAQLQTMLKEEIEDEVV